MPIETHYARVIPDGFTTGQTRDANNIINLSGGPGAWNWMVMQWMYPQSFGVAKPNQFTTRELVSCQMQWNIKAAPLQSLATPDTATFAGLAIFTLEEYYGYGNPVNNPAVFIGQPSPPPALGPLLWRTSIPFAMPLAFENGRILTQTLPPNFLSTDFVNKIIVRETSPNIFIRMNVGLYRNSRGDVGGLALNVGTMTSAETTLSLVVDEQTHI